MTIVKNAVRAKITGILSRYSEKSVGNVYFHLYESIEDEGISSTLSFLHQEINSLLVSMNKRSKTGTRYYLADDSRELIRLIQDAKSITESLKLLGYTLSINHDYLEHLLYVKTFLELSGGSTIPVDYECIEIKDVEPIFKLSGKNKIVETQEFVKEQPPAKSQNAPLDNGIFPPKLISKLPDDIKILADDFNFNLSNDRAYTCMLIMRRMLPLSVVRRFQLNNQQESIKKDNGEYLDTKALLIKTDPLISNKKVYKELLSSNKMLLDASQHSYTFRPEFYDVKTVAITLRLFLDELFPNIENKVR